MHIRANVGACLSLKGELAQEHLRIRYMQFIETTACLNMAVLYYKPIQALFILLVEFVVFARKDCV